jgi:hypothetical protein
VVKESEEGISSLRTYAETEAPKLKAAIDKLAETYETLEQARKEKTETLKAEFIAPLEDLLVSFKERQKELKDVENAKKEVEKAEKKYDKENVKPAEKKDPAKLDAAKAQLDAAKKNLAVQEKESDAANKKFEAEKTETLKKVLDNIVSVEKKFHESMLKKIKELEQKASTLGAKSTTSET